MWDDSSRRETLLIFRFRRRFRVFRSDAKRNLSNLHFLKRSEVKATDFCFSQSEATESEDRRFESLRFRFKRQIA